MALNEDLPEAALERMLLNAIGSVVDANSAIYVAGPLATGIDYYRRIAAGKSVSDIRSLNEAAMRAIVIDLRERQTQPVIDSSFLTIPDWTSRRIGDFFLKIINEFAREVRLMDGWAFSSGATKEFAHAIMWGKPCCDMDGNAISRDDGIEMMMQSAKQLDDWGVADHKMHQRVAFAMHLSSQ